MPADSRSVVIIGGGYSGVACAVHLARAAREPLEITIVEPRPELGRGIAHSAKDPDHRLNAPTQIHCLYPDDMDHFAAWCDAKAVGQRDPDALDGERLYARRWDFGTYIGEQLAAHRAGNPSDSTITHRQAAAVDIAKQGKNWAVSLDDGGQLTADAVILTTSNAPPSVPPPFRGEVEGHTAFFRDPWDIDALGRIADDARILIVGTGLTMADVVTTLMRDGPARRITAVSRRGLLPAKQRKEPPDETLLEALTRKPSKFVDRHGKPDRLLDVFRALRGDIAASAEQGREWHIAFDDLRDAASEVWPALPRTEQARFMRHLRPWYETHRFRLPPQNAEAMDRGVREGRLEFHAADIIGAQVSGNCVDVSLKPRRTIRVEDTLYDAVVNCTGPVNVVSAGGNPLLHSLIEGGLALANPFGLGLEVDDDCRVQGRNGSTAKTLYAVGPLTRGRFGESNGVPFIMLQAVAVGEKLAAQFANRA